MDIVAGAPAHSTRANGLGHVKAMRCNAVAGKIRFDGGDVPLRHCFATESADGRFGSLRHGAPTYVYLTLPFCLAVDLIAMVFCSFGIAMMALENKATSNLRLAFTDDLTGP